MLERIQYKPTSEERRLGLRSSIDSTGVVGAINRLVYRMTRANPDLFGDQVDIAAFGRHWKNMIT